jgi:hypothetical protein
MFLDSLWFMMLSKGIRKRKNEIKYTWPRRGLFWLFSQQSHFKNLLNIKYFCILSMPIKQKQAPNRQQTSSQCAKDFTSLSSISLSLSLTHSFLRSSEPLIFININDDVYIVKWISCLISFMSVLVVYGWRNIKASVDNFSLFKLFRFSLESFLKEK